MKLYGKLIDLLFFFNVNGHAEFLDACTKPMTACSKSNSIHICGIIISINYYFLINNDNY
jgi:hypothetical protein